MSVSNALHRLAEVVAGVEADDVEVCDAAIPADTAAIADGKVHITLDLAVALDEPTGEQTETTGTAGTGTADQAVIAGVVDETIPGDGQDDAASETASPDSNGQTSKPESAPMQTDSAGTDSGSVAVETTEESDSGTDTVPAEPDDGTVVCPEPNCDETFESEPGMKIHRTKIHLRAQDTDDTSGTTPAYRDPDALQEVYDAYDSFPAMREALAVDVSAQTVRRHMIQHGIHDPSGGTEESDHDSEQSDADGTTDTTETTAAAESSETAEKSQMEVANEDPAEGEGDTEAEANGDGDTEAESEGDGDTEAEAEGDGDTEVEADAVEPEIPESSPLAETLPADVTAPADVTFAELKEAVRTADTLYHIQQQFGLSREEAQDLLRYLDLLELVHGRVATKHEREELKAEIDSRIRHSINGNGTSA